MLLQFRTMIIIRDLENTLYGISAMSTPIFGIKMAIMVNGICGWYLFETKYKTISM